MLVKVERLKDRAMPFKRVWGILWDPVGKTVQSKIKYILHKQFHAIGNTTHNYRMAKDFQSMEGLLSRGLWVRFPPRLPSFTSSSGLRGPSLRSAREMPQVRRFVSVLIAVFCLLGLATPTMLAADLPQKSAVSPEPGDVFATGNTWIALPEIRAEDGALVSFNVLSMRERGLLEVRGDGGAPVDSADVCRSMGSRSLFEIHHGS